jgi:hypothetical protein
VNKPKSSWKAIFSVVSLAVLALACGFSDSGESKTLAPLDSGPVATPTASSEAAEPELEYIGLPADEVDRLREQCLAENPDALCMPVPVDLSQLGVSVEYEGAQLSDLRIWVPVGTEFLAPCNGRLEWSSRGLHRWFDIVCYGGPPSLALSTKVEVLVDQTSFLTPEEYDLFCADHPGRSPRIVLGERLFASKTLCGPWINSTAVIGLYFHPGSDPRAFVEDYPLEMALLQDEAGRVVYIKP